jgi:hypothetical protein
VCGAQLTGNHLCREVPATAGLFVEPGSRFEGSEVVAKRTIKNKRRYVFKVLTLAHVLDV